MKILTRDSYEGARWKEKVFQKRHSMEQLQLRAVRDINETMVSKDEATVENEINAR